MTTPLFLTDLSCCHVTDSKEFSEQQDRLHPDIRRIEVPVRHFDKIRPVTLRDSISLSLLDPDITQLMELPTLPDFSIQAGVTETFSAHHFGCSVRDRLNDIENLCESARPAGVSPTVYLHGAFCCPFEGPTAAQSVAGLAAKLFRAGCAHFYLADTCGSVTPEEVQGLINVISSQIPKTRLGFLFTQSNPALKNMLAVSRKSGIQRFCCAQLPRTPVPLAERELFVPYPELISAETSHTQET